MENKETEYLKVASNNKRIVRTEILFTPVLIIFPLIVSALLIYDFFDRGYEGELILGIIILISNILFGIPFVSSLIDFKRYEKILKKLMK